MDHRPPPKKLPRFKMITAFVFAAATAHLIAQVFAGPGVDVAAKGAFVPAFGAGVTAAGPGIRFKDIAVHNKKF